MPTYVYECRACSERFERNQKMTDAPVEVCPECGGNVRRVLFAPAISFKGPGFYVNDYKATVPPPAPSCSAASSCKTEACPAKQAAEAAA